VYDEVTVASCVLLDEERAAAEIVRCVEACLRNKRPVYIEVPHDMVDREIPVPAGLLVEEAAEHRTDPEALRAAMQETWRMLSGARKPILLAGVELHRFGLTDVAIRMAEKFNIPIAADLLSKSAVAENHPLYLGVYGGAMSSDRHVREYVIREKHVCVSTLLIEMFRQAGRKEIAHRGNTTILSSLGRPGCRIYAEDGNALLQEILQHVAVV